MEREKAIKIGVAAVIGLAAVIILVMTLTGGGPTVPDVPEAVEETPVESRDGGGRMAPGAGDE